jgi:cytidylate kinase
MSGLSLATSAGVAYAVRELQLRQALPALGRDVLAEATRQPCVILASGAFAAMDECAPALHVRVRAPLEWRIENQQRSCLVDRHHAAKAVKHDDHVNRAVVKALYHVDIEDPRHFAVVLDASRFSCDRAAEVLLAAGGFHESAAETRPSAAAGARSGTYDR